MAKFRQPKPEEVKAAAPLVAGVGDSRRFIAENEEDQLDPYRGIRGCTIGGKPVEEVVSPEMAHLFTYYHTDQGLAERQARQTAVRIEVGNGEFENSLLRHEESTQPWEFTDPVHALVKEHLKPGQRGRILSPVIIQKSGMRGWKPVIAENGDPVRLGRGILAYMPEEMAERRRKHFEDLGNDAIREGVEAFSEKQDRLAREAARAGMTSATLRPGQAIRGATSAAYGRKSRTGEAAEAPMDAQVGLRSVRGNSNEME